MTKNDGIVAVLGILMCILHISVTSMLADERCDAGQFCQQCNVPREVLRIEAEGSLELPLHPRIFVFQNLSRNVALSTMVSRQNLISRFGNVPVKLTSSNSYSHGDEAMTMAEYIFQHVDQDVHTTGSNESLYLFGNNYDGVFNTMAKLYEVPPCKFCEKAGAKTMGMGGKNSGVSFHFHGPGFSEVVIGAKQWFLFPPTVNPVPGFHPNMTMKQWASDIFPTLSENDNVYQCVIHPGNWTSGHSLNFLLLIVSFGVCAQVKSYTSHRCGCTPP